ncbi:MAG: proton-conducting transporter membrane subunit [Candidatus Omnitrophota bacterium]
MLLILLFLPLFCAFAVFLPVRRIFRGGLLCAVSFIHSIIVSSFWLKLPVSEFNGYLVLDSLGLILLSVVSFLFLIVSVFMVGYFKHEQRSNRTFTACLFILLSTMTVVSLSYHMGLLWIAVETTTLLSAPLISFHRNQQTLDVTWKYLLVCSVGIALALMGTFFLAIAAHDLHSLLLPALLNGAASLTVNWLKLSVIFLLVGYGCKMGLAPMHSWKPEVYGQATGMVAVLMSGVLTQCAFLALIRVAQICNKTGLSQFYSSMLIMMALLSFLVPAIFILGEKNIKRAFGYSSVEHMGILVLGLALGGVGVFGALFHMINNAIAKAIMFLTAGSVAQKYGSSSVDKIKGVIHVYPLTGAFLIVSLLAGTGMFPFATFHSELMILNAVIIGQHYILAALFIICLAFIFIGIARIVLEIVYGSSTKPVLANKENFFMNAAIIVSIAALVGIGIWMPTPLVNVLRAATVLVGA